MHLLLILFSIIHSSNPLFLSDLDNFKPDLHDNIFKFTLKSILRICFTIMDLFLYVFIWLDSLKMKIGL